jgi:hypothetical protein
MRIAFGERGGCGLVGSAKLKTPAGEAGAFGWTSEGEISIVQKLFNSIRLMIVRVDSLREANRMGRGEGIQTARMMLMRSLATENR